MSPPLTKADIATFLAKFGDLQLNATGADMAACLAMPIAYYLPEKVLIFTEPEKIAERFDTHRTYLQVCRVTQIEIRRLRILDATSERAFAQFEWHYLSAEGKVLRRSEVHYALCRADTPLGLQIELVDYATIAFPQFMQHHSMGGRA